MIHPAWKIYIVKTLKSLGNDRNILCRKYICFALVLKIFQFWNSVSQNVFWTTKILRGKERLGNNPNSTRNYVFFVTYPAIKYFIVRSVSLVTGFDFTQYTYGLYLNLLNFVETGLSH